MYKIGITGGIACGKTTVTDMLEEKGLPIIDADVGVAHLYTTKPIQEALVQTFGTLDKIKIRDIVFNDHAEKAKLEAILHPAVNAWMDEQTQKHADQGHKSVGYAIPLLFEIQAQDRFDAILAVVCDVSDQIDRLKHRDNLSLAQARAVIANQWSMDTKANKSDYVINNVSTIDQLKEDVNHFWNWLEQKIN